MELKYDLHIHSCLSPCADDDMTPYNIVNMAVLSGLDVIAITDHNSTKNCAAAMHAGQQAGLCVIPGMELTSAEDIHLLCLFESLDGATEFEQLIFEEKLKIKNKPHIFGRQIVYGTDDKPVAEEEYLLTPATAVHCHKAAALVKGFGGVCLPAHIDRPSGGILSILGAVEPWMGFNSLEISAVCPQKVREKYSDYTLLTNSDAHNLQALCGTFDTLTAEKCTAKSVVKRIKNFTVTKAAQE